MGHSQLSFMMKLVNKFVKWEVAGEGAKLDNAESAETEAGDPMIFGGIKILKNKGLLLFPDGRKEPIDYTYRISESISLLYHGMTAPSGWEWFNPVREEERFKEYVERARKRIE